MQYTKLEDKIMRAWSTSDDLEDFVNQFYEGETRMTEDDVFNTLWGLKEIHDIRMKQLFKTFKMVFQLDEYAPDEIKELRSSIFNEAFDEIEKECND